MLIDILHFNKNKFFRDRLYRSMFLEEHPISKLKNFKKAKIISFLKVFDNLKKEDIEKVYNNLLELEILSLKEVYGKRVIKGNSKWFMSAYTKPHNLFLFLIAVKKSGKKPKTEKMKKLIKEIEKTYKEYKKKYYKKEEYEKWKKKYIEEV